MTDRDAIAEKPMIHLINPMESAVGGSEWRTVELYRLLVPHAEVHIWSEDTPDPELLRHVPVRRIDPTAGAMPQGGTQLFVGCYRVPGAWVAQSRARRTVLLYNTPTPRRLTAAAIALSALGARIEMIYAAAWMRDAVGMPGFVHASPIDLQRFRPADERAPGAFRIGRLSRDTADKHHLPDIALYRYLARQGCHIRIMGGTVLAPQLGTTTGVELLPAGHEPAEDFLRGLDCFYFRSSDARVEPSGRVIMEAMACGIPVVAHRRGGYAEWIEHGTDGLLFDTREQASVMLLTLKRDPALRAGLGGAARRKMEATYSAEQMRALVAFYTAAEAVTPPG